MSSRGPVLATYQANGQSTLVSQRDGRGVQAWSASLPGARGVSARPTHSVVAASDDVATDVRLFGDAGKPLPSVKASGVRVLDTALVLLRSDGTPTWAPLP